MKKRMLISIVILLLLVAGYFIFPESAEKVKNTYNKLTGFTIRGGINDTPLINTSEIYTSPVTNNITIKRYEFIPETLTIKQGDSVTWTNKDSARHTVTSDTESELDSDLLSKDNTYVHVFNEKGEFSYHCKPHPYMTGKIIVE